MNLPWTLVLFFSGALFYSISGFGGATFYLAILTFSDHPIHQMALIALACNIIVVTSSVRAYIGGRHLPWNKAWPFLATSVPCAWAGGFIQLPDTTYKVLLGSILLISGAAIFLQARTLESRLLRPMPKAAAAGLGAFLGLLSGITGIGGGVFLAPILTFRHWGSAKQIAAACSVFILLNSGAGLLARFQTGEGHILLEAWPLLVAVWLGGAVGGHLGAQQCTPVTVRQVSSGVICSSGMRLLAMALF